MFELAELAFDDLRRPNGNICIQPQPLGKADKQGKCVLRSGMYIVVELRHSVIGGRYQRHDDVVHLIDHLAERGHFRRERRKGAQSTGES